MVDERDLYLGLVPFDVIKRSSLSNKDLVQLLLLFSWWSNFHRQCVLGQKNDRGSMILLFSHS
jgi:hypothetical protein